MTIGIYYAQNYASIIYATLPTCVSSYILISIIIIIIIILFVKINFVIIIVTIMFMYPITTLHISHQAIEFMTF